MADKLKEGAVQYVSALQFVVFIVIFSARCNETVSCHMTHHSLYIQQHTVNHFRILCALFTCAV